jgi:hypothetical protein
MTSFLHLRKTLDWTLHSLGFIKSHFIFIFSLGLVAAFGRAIQLGAFGEITSWAHILLEIVIEFTRLLIFLYALGVTRVKTGALRIVQLFINKANRQQNWSIALQRLKSQWMVIIVNLVIFLVIAYVMNYVIDYAAYQTCIYTKLRASQLISDKASEWVLILFFKNISVIPFTLVFNALFLLWITNKLASLRTSGVGK